MLRMSLDETSVSTMYTGQRGTILRLWPGTQRRARAYARAMPSQLWASFTHVAIICDCPPFQPVLVHMFIRGASMLPKQKQASFCQFRPTYGSCLRWSASRPISW